MSPPSFTTPVEWLVHCPPSDENFRSHLRTARVDELREALHHFDTRPASREALRREMLRRGRRAARAAFGRISLGAARRRVKMLRRLERCDTDWKTEGGPAHA